MHTKVIYYNSKSKKDIELEIELQNVSSSYGFSPKILNSTFLDDKCIIEMEKIDDVCLFYKYGNNPENIPKYVWHQIRQILFILLEKEAIEYINITPYNFIEKDGGIYILDFGDAYYSYESGDAYINSFLDDFLDGTEEWNEEFY